MAKKKREPQIAFDEDVDRRMFLKYGAAFSTAVAMSGLSFENATAVDLTRKDVTGKHKVLGCNPQTSTDGYWDNSTKPVLEVNSGDVVEIETGTHLMGQMIPGATIEDWMKWFKEVIDKTPETYTYPDTLTGARKMKRGLGHHHLTGPIYVNGAEPGDILQVEILEIVPTAYGFNLNPETSFVKLGLLADEYPKGKTRWYRVDLKNMKFEFAPGVEIRSVPSLGPSEWSCPMQGCGATCLRGATAGILTTRIWWPVPCSICQYG
ncbi:MAG: acetamidase/formamidase family protein [Candidatus Moduliflexus flocculans]|nr:acetamidase/formamidase family protein [Candidatus Moduliflexus flocculans]